MRRWSPPGCCPPSPAPVAAPGAIRRGGFAICEGLPILPDGPLERAHGKPGAGSGNHAPGALAPEHGAAICAIGGERHYPAGSIVMDIGEPLDRFVHVLEGGIEVVNPHTGARLFTHALGPTQFMGEIGFLNGATNYPRMRAAVDTRVIEAPRAAMLAPMRRVPELPDHVITVFAARRRMCIWWCAQAALPPRCRAI